MGMADAWKKMEKMHGSEGLFIGNMENVGKCDVISTGSYRLNDALGIGGLPRGGLVQFAGIQSSGKTLLSLLTIAEWQKENPENWAMFIDAEYTYDPTWAAQLGVDNNRVMVYKENRGVQIFERLVGQPGKKLGSAKSKQGILDIEIESGGSGLGIIVLDSVAAIVPPIEETAEVGKQNMSPLSRFLPAELRKLTPMLSAANVAFICINQLRDKPGVMYGDPTDTPGGRCLKHAQSVAINFAKMTGAEAKIERNDEMVGHFIRARIDKNKRAVPYRVAEFAIEYTTGVVKKNEEIRDLAVKYGIITRPNNRTYIFDGEEFNGKDKMAAAFESEEKQKEMWVRILDARNQIIASGEIIHEQVDVPEVAEDGEES